MTINDMQHDSYQKVLSALRLRIAALERERDLLRALNLKDDEFFTRMWESNAELLKLGRQARTDLEAKLDEWHKPPGGAKSRG